MKQPKRSVLVRRAALFHSLLLLAATLGACRRPGAVEAVVDHSGRHAVPRPLDVGGKLDALFDGRIRLIGAAGPGTAVAGTNARVTLFFLVERECGSADPTVFVHVAAPGAEVNQAVADHKILGGAIAPAEWKPGDLLVDAFDIAIPKTLAVDELLVWAGLYEGKDRWPVTPQYAQDGKDRVEVARIHVDGAPPFLASAEAHKRTAAVRIDGILDEPDWGRAPVLGPFASWDGKTPIERPTTARIFWDEQNLYLAFLGEDPDVFTPYLHKDDPLYDSEAVEIFIDADGDKDVYVELQAAPKNDAHFDAAFAGGRRKNMDKSYDAAFETKTTVDAHGFISEWRIPVKGLKDVPAGEPRVGASWKINLFRLERIRANPDNGRVTKSEASAWSTPLSGDFHNLERFGTLNFVE